MKVLFSTTGVLYFSQWCRKGYAVFAALGKQVHISELPLNICKCALLKSSQKGKLIMRLSCREKNAEEITRLEINRKMKNILIVMREVCPLMKEYKNNYRRVCCLHALF